MKSAQATWSHRSKHCSSLYCGYNDRSLSEWSTHAESPWWLDLATINARNVLGHLPPAAVVIQSANGQQNRLVSDSLPPRLGILSYGPTEIVAVIPYQSESSIDAVRVWIDGEQTQPGELSEVSRQLVFRGNDTVTEIRFRWDCPPLGRHRIQITYLRGTYWSYFSQPVQVEILPPPTPQIIAIASGDQQPRPFQQRYATKTSGTVTLKLAGVKPNDRVAIDFDGDRVGEAVVGSDCCVRADFSRLGPPGRYSLSVRALSNHGCGLSSKASKRIWVDYFDADSLIEVDDPIGNGPLKFAVENIGSSPLLPTFPTSVPDLPVIWCIDPNCTPETKTVNTGDLLETADQPKDTVDANESEPDKDSSVQIETNGLQLADTWQDPQEDEDGVHVADDKDSETLGGFPVEGSINVTEENAIETAAAAKIDAAQQSTAHHQASIDADKCEEHAVALMKAAVEKQKSAHQASIDESNAVASAAAKSGLVSALEKSHEDLRQKSALAEQAAFAAHRVWLAKIEGNLPALEAQAAWQIAAQVAKEKSQAIERSAKDLSNAKSHAEGASAAAIEAGRRASEIKSAAVTAKQEAFDAAARATEARARSNQLGVTAAGMKSWTESVSKIANDAIKKNANEKIRNSFDGNLVKSGDPVSSVQQKIDATALSKDLRYQADFLTQSVEELSQRVKEENEALFDRLFEIDGATGEILTRMLEMKRVADEVCEQAQVLDHYRGTLFLNDQEKARIIQENRSVDERISAVLDLRKNIQNEALQKLLTIFVDAGVLTTNYETKETSDSLGEEVNESSKEWMEARKKALEAIVQYYKLCEQKDNKSNGMLSVPLQVQHVEAVMPRGESNPLALLYQPKVQRLLKEPRFQPIADATVFLAKQIRDSQGRVDAELATINLLVETLKLERFSLNQMTAENKNSTFSYPDATAIARQKTIVEIAAAIVAQRQSEHATVQSNGSLQALIEAKTYHRSTYKDYQSLVVTHDAIVAVAKQRELLDQAKASLVKAHQAVAKNNTNANLNVLKDAQTLYETRKATLKEAEAKIPNVSVLAFAEARRINTVKERLGQIVSQLQFTHIQLKDRVEWISQQMILYDRIAASVDDLRTADDEKLSYVQYTLELTKYEVKRWRSLSTLEGAQLHQQLVRAQDFSLEHQHRMKLAEQLANTQLKNDRSLEESAERRAKSYWANVQARKNARVALRKAAPPTTTYFHSPAHFPIPRSGNRGLDDAREGLTISEGMKIITRADGSYSVMYQVRRVDLPLVLSMQVQFQTSADGPWHTITLKPQAISQGGDNRNTIHFENLKLNDFDKNRLLTIEQSGTHPALTEYGGRVVKVRRRGNAQYGFGYRGLDVYGNISLR